MQHLEWIDIHAHLQMLEEGPVAALALASVAGVARVITIGTEPADHPKVVELCATHENVFGALGIHPHDAPLWNSGVADFIRTHVNSQKRIVAIGEIGLDYFYKNENPQEQMRLQKIAFREQLELAAELSLPVEIHTRDAEEDTIAILEEFRGRVRGVIHCFTGTSRLAHEALARGYNISISGIITFKNAEDLRATVREIPVDRLHVETDAPFLAPVPYRGKKNTPAYMTATAAFVADLKGMALPEFCAQLKINAETMFPRLIS